MYDYLYVNSAELERVNFGESDFRDALKRKASGPSKGSKGVFWDVHEKVHRRRCIRKPKEKPWLYTEGLMVVEPKNEPFSEPNYYRVRVFSRKDQANEEEYLKMMSCYMKQNEKIKNLVHPNLLKNLILLETGTKFYHVRQWASRGSLADAVSKNGFIAEPLAQMYFAQLASAVAYLHSNAVVHGHINCQNVMLDQRNSVLLAGIHVKEKTLKSDLKTFNKGPIFYQAPEVFFRADAYSDGLSMTFSEEVLQDVMRKFHKVSFRKYVRSLRDVWSMGAVLFVMLWGVAPFTNDEYKAMVLQGSSEIKPRPGKPKKTGALSVSPAAEALYTRMMAVELAKRPRAIDVLNDTWTRTDQVNYEENRKRAFEKAWNEFYCSGVKLHYFVKNTTDRDKLNLTALRYKKSTFRFDSSQNLEKREEYYATFVPVELKGGGWMDDRHKSAFSATQKEALRLYVSDKLSSAPFVRCFQPRPKRSDDASKVHCEVIWLQSHVLQTQDNGGVGSSRNGNVGILPLLGLVRGGQAHHAVLHRMVGGKPLMESPRYAILYVQPSAVLGPPEDEMLLPESGTKSSPPRSFEDPVVWDYLQTVMKEKGVFEEEFHRLLAPILEGITAGEEGFKADKVLPGAVRKAMADIEFRKNKIKQLQYCKEKL